MFFVINPRFSNFKFSLRINNFESNYSCYRCAYVFKKIIYDIPFLFFVSEILTFVLQIIRSNKCAIELVAYTLDVRFSGSLTVMGSSSVSEFK